MMYDSLQQLLQQSFERYANMEFFPGVLYSQYQNRIEERYEQWKKWNLTEDSILVIQDNGGKSNLLDILTAMYHGHRICMIHNALFFDNSMKRLELVGIVERKNSESIAAIVTSNEYKISDIIASTSGTTGEPKLVQHDQRSILENIEAIEEYLCPENGDTIFLQRNPIYLSVLTGEILLGIERGCRFYIPDYTRNPIKMITDIQEYSVNVLVSVMSYFDMLLPMLKKYADSLQTLKYLQFVGEGGRAGLINDLVAILPDTDIIIGYGLTEAGPRVSYMSCKEMEPEQYLVGRLLRGVKAHSVDDNGEVLKPGHKGRIEIASPSLMYGYLGYEPVKEWFTTSDYGWVDENERLYIQGRLDDIVIRNGVKVPLITIEQSLMHSGMITGAVAFAIAKKNGIADRVDVCVTSDLVSSTLSEDILKWCRSNIDSCLWPNKIHVMEQFIFKKNGKLDKKAIFDSIFSSTEQ